LFLTENFKQAVGSTFGEKMSALNASWNSLSSKEKEGYKARAPETLFGVRAQRAAQRERELERVAAAKEKVAEKKLKEKAYKKKKEEEEKAKKAELKKAEDKAKKLQEKLKAKEDSDKKKAKRDVDKKKAKPGKKTIEATT